MAVNVEAAKAGITLRCIACGAVAEAMPRGCRCPACGDVLEVYYPRSPLGSLAPAAAKALWRQRRTTALGLDASGVWRFRELLPVLPDPAQAITLQEGNTPLYDLPRCGAWIGVPGLWAKHQGQNPTGSFKDTGMTVAVSQAQQAGAEWLACASTGNTSASMAAYAARAGLRSLVLVPEGKIAPAKLAQALDHAAVTLQLRTDFDGCVRVLGELVERLPITLVNSINPYRLEGQKTAAVEMLEQRDWQVPDHVVVPGGNLANASALGKGFLELRTWGLIERVPRISIIQAAGANPLVRTLRENGGRELIPVAAETLASAIRIGRPASWKKAVRVLRETEGACVDVSEDEIAAAKAMLGREGIGCEPASAAALAGAAKQVLQGVIAAEDSVVLLLTGHELKDTGYSLAYHHGELPLAAVPKRTLPVLDATLEAVRRALERA